MSEIFSAIESKRSHQVSSPFPHVCFEVEGFIHYGSYDPAGLCDGGDYIKHLKIELKDNNIVHVSWRKTEHSEIGTDDNNWFAIPYAQFFDLIMPKLALLKKESQQKTGP